MCYLFKERSRILPRFVAVRVPLLQSFFKASLKGAIDQTIRFEVHVDVRHKVYQGPADHLQLVAHTVYKDMPFAKIPAMLGSSICNSHHNLEAPWRDKGIFVISGYVKTLITQSQLRSNYPYRAENCLLN